MKKSLFIVNCSLLIAMALPLHAAVTRGTSVIAASTTVRQRVTPTGLFSQECYDSYFGCMDQFCMSEYESGGACTCHDDNAKFEKMLGDIEQQNKNAELLRTVEVEKIQVGAKADIVFGTGRQYDEKGNVIQLDAKEMTPKERREARRLNLEALWNNNNNLDDIWGDSVDSIAGKTGAGLYSAARQLCTEQMPANCTKDMTMLTQLYSTQIRNDCRAFENALKDLRRKSDALLAEAQRDVRDARLASFDEANKFDQGQCMLEFRKCMNGPDVCGADWGRCVGILAGENMQVVTKSTARTRVPAIDHFQISDSTMESLDSKRNICENVLNQCMAVRDLVWPAFLREIAPDLKTAELNAESNKRQSCLGNISACIQKACKDDIEGKGVDTMDACLSRPDMARSFCKVQIDPCERMEPQIWLYVKDKLAAMRVDRCTEEVKECFTSEDRCGANFMNCIGMDYAFLHEMCPVDKLVVCKQGNANFSMSDIDNMLMGFYLNVDNAALENCQNIVSAKMMEVCGSTTDCDKFTADDNIGTSSLASTNINGVYTISGMISFGQIKIGTGREKVQDLDGKTITLGAGRLNMRDYFERVGKLGVPNEYGRVIDNIFFEMESLQGRINAAIDMIEQDPKIQYCITGRDLSQIQGSAGMTTARFPNLLNQIKMQIAMSAIRRAQENYNAKFNQMVAEASRSASTDFANLMCNKLPFSNGQASGTTASDLENNVLAVPFAVILQFGGVSAAALAAGGTHTSEKLGGARQVTESGMAAGATNETAAGKVAIIGAGSTAASGIVAAFNPLGGAAGAMVSGPMAGTAALADATVKAIGILASDRRTVEFEGGTKEMWTIFNRESRICHYCTLVIGKECETKGSRGFLGLWDSRGMKCKEKEPVESCKDIPM